MMDTEPLIRAAGEVTRLQETIEDSRRTIRECQQDIANAKPRLASAIVELQELAGNVAVKALTAAPEDTVDPDGVNSQTAVKPAGRRQQPAASSLPRIIDGHMTVHQFLTSNNLLRGNARGKVGSIAIAVSRAWEREGHQAPEKIYTDNRTTASVYPTAWLNDYFTRPNTRV